MKISVRIIVGPTGGVTLRGPIIESYTHPFLERSTVLFPPSEKGTADLLSYELYVNRTNRIEMVNL